MHSYVVVVWHLVDRRILQVRIPLARPLLEPRTILDHPRAIGMEHNHSHIFINKYKYHKLLLERFSYFLMRDLSNLVEHGDTLASVHREVVFILCMVAVEHDEPAVGILEERMNLWVRGGF